MAAKKAVVRKRTASYSKLRSVALACLAVLPTGEVFVGVDMMGSLGKEPGYGSIVKLIDANKLTGATVDRISITDFPDYKINLPPLLTQRKISSILSAYDDLIENNLKRIKLLEEKAFLRYKGIVREEKMVLENKLEDIIQTVKRKPKVLKSSGLMY